MRTIIGEQKQVITALRRRLTAAFLTATAASLSCTAHARVTASGEDGTVARENDPGATAGGWRLMPELRLTARAIVTEARGGEAEETIDGDAVALVATTSVEWGNGTTAIVFRNALTRVEYFDGARADRWQNVARLSGRFKLGDSTRATLFGERSDNLFAAEFTSADEWEAGGEIEHDIDTANRLSIGASWRERHYDDPGRSRGRGVRIESEYRHRFATNHFAYARLRRERIASIEARRDLSRWLAEASYLRPVARDLRAGAEISYQRIEFGGRQLASGGVRRDDIITPQLSLTYSPGAWRLGARARYALRQSTDPAFDRSGYRFEVEVSHAF